VADRPEVHSIEAAELQENENVSPKIIDVYATFFIVKMISFRSQGIIHVFHARLRTYAIVIW
jgi:hypothetical protein